MLKLELRDFEQTLSCETTEPWNDRAVKLFLDDGFEWRGAIELTSQHARELGEFLLHIAR